MLYSWLHFDYKGGKSSATKPRDLGQKFGRVLNVELRWPLSSVLWPCPHCTSVCSPNRKLHQALVSRVFTGVSLCKHKGLAPGHVFEPSLQLSSCSTRWSWLRARPSNQELCLSGWPILILSHLNSLHKLRCDPRGSWITKTFLWLRKFQGFRVYYSGTEEKVQPHSLLYSTHIRWHKIWNSYKKLSCHPLKNQDTGKILGYTAFEPMFSFFFSCCTPMSASNEKATLSQLTTSRSFISSGGFLFSCRGFWEIRVHPSSAH